MQNSHLSETGKSNLVVAAQSIPALLGAKNGAHYLGQALLTHAQAVALFSQAEGVNPNHLWEGLALRPPFSTNAPRSRARRGEKINLPRRP